ncbi:MAG: response regulator [Candidatus Omnitrophica bacterium]|nr:response regulator [Candidatus Omnitrophota bacterium]
MSKPKILVVDDDYYIIELLEDALRDDFNVIKASTGKEAIERAHSDKPDIVVLDYNLSDTTGIEVCKVLRSDPFFIHLPILMLTGKGEVEDKVKGLNAGVDDYVVKPFQPLELVARVHMLIRRSTINLDANPLTRLPGNVTITKEIEKCIKSDRKFAIFYLDLDNFKALNDYYGFERGDQVIRDFARIIIEVIQKEGSPNDFIGHLGGDDFVLITSPDKAERIAQEIIKTFNNKVPSFYDHQDKLKGYIETRDRNGQIRKFPFITVSIGIITNINRKFSHVAEISAIGAELKDKAKRSLDKKYIIDRRSS